MKWGAFRHSAASFVSLPVRGAWIEIFSGPRPAVRPVRSLPVRGAWIEIVVDCPQMQENQSLPVRGAWIEISLVCL